VARGFRERIPPQKWALAVHKVLYAAHCFWAVRLFARGSPTSIVLVRTRACDSAVEEECVSVCVRGDGMRRPAAVQAPTHPPSLHFPSQHLSQYHTVNITGSVCVLRVFVQLAWEGSKHVCAKRIVPFCCHGQAPHCPFLPPLCSTAVPTVRRKRLRRYPKGSRQPTSALRYAVRCASLRTTATHLPHTHLHSPSLAPRAVYPPLHHGSARIVTRIARCCRSSRL
jgi:hypothetical protein